MLSMFFSVDRLRCGNEYTRKKFKDEFEGLGAYFFKFIFHSSDKRSFSLGARMGGVLFTEKIPLW